MSVCLGEICCSGLLLNRNEELIHAQALWDFMLVEIPKGTVDNILDNFQNEMCMWEMCNGQGWGENKGTDFSLCFLFTALLTLQMCTKSCLFHFSV